MEHAKPPATADGQPPLMDDPDATDRGDPTLDPTDPAVRRALDSMATELVLLISARGEVVSSNRLVNLGYAEDEQVGSHIGQHLHPDDLPRVFDLIERARATAGLQERITVRARHADGSWRRFSCEVLDAALAHPDLEGAIIRARDITDDVAPASTPGEASPDLAEDSRFLSLAELVPLGILSADARGWVVFTNQAACRLFDLTTEQVQGSGWLRAIHDEDRDEVAATAAEVIQAGEPREAVFRVATGLFVRWAHARFEPLGDDRRTGWIATLDDITDRQRAESQLAHLATHDSLTKLPNRSLLEDRLRRAAARLRRDDSSLAVLFVDLDGFKAVNDTHGHAAGDRVLVEVARRLRHAVRDVDTVARLGGDEFVVVGEDMGEDEAAEVAERIEASLEPAMIVGGAPVRVGGSVGWVTSSDPDADVTDLLGRADQAMYRVKREHRAHAG